MESTALPPLRDDLALHPGPTAHDGGPTWTIHDPLRNRFIRIGERVFQLLSAWHLGEAKALMAQVEKHWGRRPDGDEIAWLSEFLAKNALLRAEAPREIARLSQQAKAARLSWWQWLIHNYLFFRIPLVRPDAMLHKMVRWTAPLYSSGFLWLTIALGAIGLLLTIRQWDLFVHTFMGFYSWQGLIWYGIALGGAKLAHELGHAITAKRLGCRVPTMGLAFLVLWPVLYTDTGDAWKLVERRQRLAIGMAGMATELMLACFATFLWSFLPDGPARNAAFLTATVTWTLTLAINLNPMMRFDGYYLLSDTWGIENLQSRAFALARWRLREALFGLGESPPEQFAPGLRRRLLIYAFATWIYRFFLFLGIALLVYALFFKALGLLLFAVEIVWFIARPIQMEVRAWWQRREKLRLNRQSLTSLLLLAGLMGSLFYPWQGSIRLSAVMRAGAHAYLFAPIPARIAASSLQSGSRVTAGETLLTLAAPDLESDMALARLRIDIAEKLVAREAAGEGARQEIAVLRQRLLTERTRLEGLQKRKAQLVVRAPFSGRVLDVAKALHPGRWINESLPLGLVVADDSTRIRAYVTEPDLTRITLGQTARFIPDDPALPVMDAKVATIARVNARKLEEPYLASVLGGSLPVRLSAQGELIPTLGIYQVELDTAEQAPAQVMRGIVLLEGEHRAIASRLWQHAAAVLIRESGF